MLVELRTYDELAEWRKRINQALPHIVVIDFNLRLGNQNEKQFTYEYLRRLRDVLNPLMQWCREHVGSQMLTSCDILKYEYDEFGRWDFDYGEGPVAFFRFLTRDDAILFKLST